MRSASNAAGTATTVAANTGARLGADASGISASLTPFLTSEIQNPQGYGQQETSAMLSSAEGGAGGATAGIAGEAAQRAATSRNAGGFSAVLDDAARERTKAAAGASEGIEAQNAGVKQEQQQAGARGLQGMYGTDTSGMLDSTGQEAGDVNAQVGANKQGWLQNAEGILSTINQSGNAAAGMKGAGFFGG